MKKEERARAVLAMLKQLFPKVVPPLNHKDPYTLLVSVVLSARCTDVMVNKVTPDLFALADSPTKMFALDEKEIRKIIRPCGLSPAKAKNIKALSAIIAQKYAGEVPKTFHELEALPGVGHKTASVVLSQIFDVYAFPVDTHIHRLARRWGLSNGKNVEQTERDLKKLFPKETWRELHIRMILYGRAYCQARGCFGVVCPICRQLFPRRKKKIA